MPEKLDFLHQKRLGPADELREILDSLEDRRVAIRSMNPTEALILLRDLDQVYRLFDQLETAKVDLKPERGRFESTQSRLRKNASALLKALGGVRALEEHRPRPEPTDRQWWWYVDAIVAEQQRRFRRQLAVVVSIVVLLVSGAILAFNTVLAPSPEVLARVQAEYEAYNAIDAGEFQEAVGIIDAGLLEAPGDPGLHILKGALHELLGEGLQADRSFDQAKLQLSDPRTFHIVRGQTYLRLNQPFKAEEEATTVLDLNDEVEEAWLLLGQVLETQGRNSEAIQAYDRASKLAIETGNNEVVVLSRLALGRLSLTP